MISQICPSIHVDRGTWITQMDGSRRGARPKIGGKFLPPVTAVIASLGPAGATDSRAHDQPSAQCLVDIDVLICGRGIERRFPNRDLAVAHGSDLNAKSLHTLTSAGIFPLARRAFSSAAHCPGAEILSARLRSRAAFSIMRIFHANSASASVIPRALIRPSQCANRQATWRCPTKGRGQSAPIQHLAQQLCPAIYLAGPRMHITFVNFISVQAELRRWRPQSCKMRELDHGSFEDPISLSR
jgi:hypothetical protein